MPGFSLTERQRLIRESEILRDREVVNDPPRRWQIGDTTAAPYRWICHLDITYLDPDERFAEKLKQGTGVLISPRHVLTAAHTLLSEDGRAKTVRVRVTPGRNGSTKPFGSVDAEKRVTHPSWTRNGKPNRRFDYALITLEESIGARKFTSLGNRPLGFWGDPKWGAKTSRSGPGIPKLSGLIVNAAGYPGDRKAGTQWRGDGKISGHGRWGEDVEILEQDRLILHTVDTHGGESGGPVWVLYPKTESGTCWDPRRSGRAHRGQLGQPETHPQPGSADHG